MKKLIGWLLVALMVLVVGCQQQLPPVATPGLAIMVESDSGMVEAGSSFVISGSNFKPKLWVFAEFEFRASNRSVGNLVFDEAFGSNVEEFLNILSMPDEFIRFRHFFRDNGLIDYWKTLYCSLSEDEKEYLLDRICEYKTNKSIIDDNHPTRVRKILALYTINKSQFDRGEKSSHSVISKIESL